MSPERTDHWAKMRRYRAQFSGLEAFAPMRSSADYITITSEFRFSVHTVVIGLVISGTILMLP